MADGDLVTLMRTMPPVPCPRPHGHAVPDGAAAIAALATVAEAEGLTGVAGLDDPRRVGQRSASWARIGLTVQADLAALGPAAAFAGASGRAGTSCDAIAGSPRDHLFLRRDRRIDAMTAPEAPGRA
ncbi:MAG: hypothetical protein ACK4TJ_15565 [Tabrizicola sp.]